MQTPEQEFTDLFRASWARLYRLAYAVSGDSAAAEDLQNAMAKVYANWSRVRRAHNPDAYVRRVVLNEVLLVRRYGFSKRERPHAVIEPPDAVASPESGIVDRDAIWTAIQALPLRQRAVVVLCYYEDLSEAEIAETLGCSRGTVKSQASAAIKTLRRTQTGRGDGLGQGDPAGLGECGHRCRVDLDARVQAGNLHLEGAPCCATVLT